MVSEEVLPIIDKLTDAGIKHKELNTIKPLIGTEEFITTYNVVGALRIAATERGRQEIREQVTKAASEYHFKKHRQETPVISEPQHEDSHWYILPAAAAAVLFICMLYIFTQSSDYNNPAHYSKKFAMIQSRP